MLSWADDGTIHLFSFGSIVVDSRRHAHNVISIDVDGRRVCPRTHARLSPFPSVRCGFQCQCFPHISRLSGSGAPEREREQGERLGEKRGPRWARMRDVRMSDERYHKSAEMRECGVRVISRRRQGVRCVGMR